MVFFDASKKLSENTFDKKTANNLNIIYATTIILSTLTTKP